jgi:hypothetical protein
MIGLNEGRLGPITNGVLLIIMICILGLIYLSQVTKTNAYGYKISDLQAKQEQLISEHNDLEVDSARLQSLDRVKNSKAAQDLATATPSETLQN